MKVLKICLSLLLVTPRKAKPDGNDGDDGDENDDDDLDDRKTTSQIRFSQLRCPDNKVPEALGIHQLRRLNIFKPCLYKEFCNCDIHRDYHFCYFDKYCFGCIHSSQEQYCAATTKCPTETWMCGNLVKSCDTYYTHKECGGDCVYRGTVCPARTDPCYYHGASKEYPDWKCGEGDSQPQAQCKKHSEKTKFITCQGECLDISNDPEYKCPQNKEEEKEKDTKEDESGAGLYAGIIIGALLILALIGIGVYIFIKKNKLKNTEIVEMEENPTYGLGEAADDIEVKDENDYYGVENSDESETEIVDINPDYGTADD